MGVRSKTILLFAGMLILTAFGSASNHSANDSWSFDQDRVNESFSVGSSSSLNLSINGLSNSSESVDINTNGNFSDFVYSIQSPVQTIPGQDVSVLNQVSVDRDQQFGYYNGSIEGVGGNTSDSVPVELHIVDDVDPEIISTSFGSGMALTNLSFSVDARDNLNVSGVEMDLFREVEVVEDNETVLVNESFMENVSMSKSGSSTYSYTLSDTDDIGQYFANVTITDSSGNSVNTTESFRVNGLDSVHVSDSNFVFDTIEAKGETGFDLVNSSIGGKEFSVSLKSLSFGGNESVSVGVRPPGDDGFEVLEEGGEGRSYSESGVYELVLLHSGSDELEGTHRVTGELFVERPLQHVEPVNSSVSFSGTVKNLDKPQSDCLGVGAFDSCIGYSFDGVKKLFEDRHGSIDEGGNESMGYAWKISRVPTSQVEGTSEWGDSTGFTMGEFERKVDEAEQRESEAVSEMKKHKSQKRVAVVLVALFIMVSLSNSYGMGMFEAEKKIRRENIGQVADDLSEINTGRV